MISMELQPSVHVQHLNHSYGLAALPSHHHRDSLIVAHHHQHQMPPISDEKPKGEYLILNLGTSLYIMY